MVAETNTFSITPMPMSAARAATDEGSSDWVGEWVLDLATHYPAFARNAEQHADGLNLIGYTTKSSLAYMHDTTAVREIQDALELNLIMAKQLVLEGRALHPRHELADNKPPRVNYELTSSCFEQLPRPQSPSLYFAQDPYGYYTDTIRTHDHANRMLPICPPPSQTPRHTNTCTDP